MSEPGEPKLEHQLSDSDFELIHRVDFKINNVMTVLLGKLEFAQDTGQFIWTDDQLKAFQSFLRERIDVMKQTKQQFEISADASVRLLAGTFAVVSEQLMSVIRTIDMYLESRDLTAFHVTIVDANDCMREPLELFASNRAYRTYRTKVSEENRNRFTYEARRSGE